ncbi:histidine kinase dimerization/phosphoacceptor domain -containing protein [Flavobacterium sp. SUN052]|uniref:histidine kinase dimerization/phosphoacceptor domain -containing protein n=1 Tax=Flavobacterium sp. SUN052 TaxID=3002441 RepID=UPI00237D8A7A|nr:histidine kinase dimerization/phosphoacceptor domain -containing protein [Flavobacterium sp. SUN052]MEC4005947.1 histidine kinase dimerization/phosphoacceptor domain -containing protein [Flavobacterium sp. SUN052]
MSKKIYVLLFCFYCTLVFSQDNKYLNIGINFYDKSEIDSSLFYLIKYKKEKKHQDDSSNALLNLYLGKSYKIKQDFQKSFESFVVAQELFKKTKNYDKLADTYVSIAEFFRAKHDIGYSDRYLKLAKALIDTKKISDQVTAYYWNRKASICISINDDYLGSIECSKKVINIAQKIKNKDLEASSLNEIGYAYENLKDSIAEKYYKESLRIYTSINDKVYSVNVINNIVRLYAKKNQIEKAKNYIDIGYKMAVENKLNTNFRDFYQAYYLYYEKIGNYKKALFYHIESRKLEKEEFINNWNKQIIDSERKYESSKKNKQIEFDRISLLNQKNQLKKSKQLILASTILLLILLISILVIIYFYRKTNKTNEKLKFLSEQNEFLLSEANHRINNNLQLVVILISNQLRKLPENESQEIKKILTKVNSIATLHKHLYQSKDKRNIDSYKYLNDIKISFFDLFNENKIVTNFAIESIEIPTDAAMYLGLLLTELCINSLKYAFKNQEHKEINFSLKLENELLCFSYTDNGTVILDKQIKPKLIDKLCRQLKIKYVINVDKGFSFSFKKQFNQLIIKH